MTGENQEKKISVVTERFCSFLNDNTVIITTQTLHRKDQKCIYSEKCKGKCEHKK